jgi:uncharacterized protein YdaU (DUF1376 family)
MSGARPDTWMPLYWGDYLRDTGHLSTAEHGGYLLLIGHCWTSGGMLPTDDERLRRIARCSPLEWRKGRDTILSFFRLVDGVYRHKRVDIELARSAEISEMRSKAGIEGNAKRWQKDRKPIANRSQIGSQNDPNHSHSHRKRDDATASSATHEASDERSHANGLEPSHRDSPAKAGTRGTRCPADWRPDEANCRRCIELGLGLETSIIEFRNYWCAIPGSKGLKLDWQATFYNRCSEVAGRRNGLASQGRGRAGQPPSSIAEAARDVARAIDER